MHGGDIYRNKTDLDFSVNINPMGPPSEVETVLSEVVLSVNRYPDLYHEKLKKSITDLFDLSQEEVIFGNGASELIMAVCHEIMPQKALILSPGFSGYEYALNGACQDCNISYHSLLEDDDFTLKEDILQRLREEKPDLFFLTNPNNPNGKIIEKNLLEEIITVCEEQSTIVVLDECFLPLTGFEKRLSFSYRTREYKNLIVLRAFTKTFAIPGVRLGYALCQKELAEAVKRHLPEWNLSVFAQMAGEECMKHLDYLEETVELIQKERSYLSGELEKLGYKVYPSDANYILFRSNRRDLAEKLLSDGILIRDCWDYKGLSKGYYRIAVKTHMENERLLSMLKKHCIRFFS